MAQKATVIPFNSCNGGYPQNINATFNDEAYDIITFNQTGQKVPAPYTCTVAPAKRRQLQPGSDAFCR